VFKEITTMPNLNIPVSDELLRAIRVKAAAEDLSRRDWVKKQLRDALLAENVEAKTDYQNEVNA
jgi:plasmid stability protein